MRHRLVVLRVVTVTATLLLTGCPRGESPRREADAVVKRPADRVTVAKHAQPSRLPLRDNGLTIRARVDSPVKAGTDFPIQVIFAFDGPREVVVLPHAPVVHLAGIGGSRATYNPLPGPPRNIFLDPRSIARGGSVEVRSSFRRLQGGDWRLPPGTYRLTLRYAIGRGTGTSRDGLPRNSPLRTGRLWFGGVTSPPVTLVVTSPG